MRVGEQRPGASDGKAPDRCRSRSLAPLPRAATDLPKSAWTRVLARLGASEAALTARYDLVLHLVTAADGAEAAYTLSNNPARTESAEQAKELDARVVALWCSHPRRRIIDNSTDFGGKMDRCRDALDRLLLFHAADAE